MRKQEEQTGQREGQWIQPFERFSYDRVRTWSESAWIRDTKADSGVTPPSSSCLGAGGEQSQVAAEWGHLWKKTRAVSDTKTAFREWGATSGGKLKYQPINDNTSSSLWTKVSSGFSAPLHLRYSICALPVSQAEFPHLISAVFTHLISYMILYK